MFGYVIANCSILSDEQRMRFRALYCGLCRTLHELYGNAARTSLSYDMTFMALVLSALYEPDEENGSEKCLFHPFKAHPYSSNDIMAYAAAMNVALAYHKCADNWEDDKKPTFAAARLILSSAYKKAKSAWPEQCAAIESWMDENRKIERGGKNEIDPPMNLTGRMLGTLFRYKNDYWGEHLFRMGDALGRFIYFMDAYEDLEKDIKKNRYNPLRSIKDIDHYDDFCKDVLTMALADCTYEFEQMPIVKDEYLIRNILYSGVWAKYNKMIGEKNKTGRSRNRGTR